MGPVLGPHARTDRTRDTRVAEPWPPAPEDGRPGEGQRLTPGAPHNAGRPPPPGTAPHHPRGTQPPQGMQARGTVLGPHTHTPAPTARGWRTPTARPIGGQSGEGQRLTSEAPRTMVEGTPPGDALPPPPQQTRPALKGARCGAGAGSPRPHRPHPGHTGRGTPATRPRGRAAGGGTAPNTRRPSQWWKAPPRGTPFRHLYNEQGTNAPTHQPRDICTRPPALRHSDTTMAQPAAPRKTRPRSLTLDAAHEVIRVLGLRDGEGDPPQGDGGTDSDLEPVPEPSTGSAPAEPTPPAGSVPTLCPAWKRGHCTGEGWCPKQHPQPGPDDGALPELGPADACAALRYGLAQGWILDETARGSVNIQEAIDRVTDAGQVAVALHTRGRHGGPAEGIIVEPSGMVLVLAADMVRGVLHASRVRRACAQWTIQVYTPPRVWPFSTWAVLAVMWHLAPEDAPTGSAEEIARDLHTWPADQDYPWRRPRGGLPVAPAAEGLSLAATLQRHPDKRARHFLQTGTVPAAPPDSVGLWGLCMGIISPSVDAQLPGYETCQRTLPGPAPPISGMELPTTCSPGTLKAVP